ncbi:hypothetical protein BC828DRAFT_392003 [Blastocladiella britannica]|nr:hypothetical protein BC828DRAFT_392003 [Blastocladiella britannica]
MHLRWWKLGRLPARVASSCSQCQVRHRQVEGRHPNEQHREQQVHEHQWERGRAQIGRKDQQRRGNQRVGGRKNVEEHVNAHVPPVTHVKRVELAQNRRIGQWWERCLERRWDCHGRVVKEWEVDEVRGGGSGARERTIKGHNALQIAGA